MDNDAKLYRDSSENKAYSIVNEGWREKKI